MHSRTRPHSKIDGLILLRAERHSDERGSVCEIYRADLLAQIGLAPIFVQDNHSFTKQAGTIRGLHFQRPPFGQAKLILVLRGAIFDVAVDLRRSSPTFGQHLATVLSQENQQHLFIPDGFAHGFCTLTDDVEVLYKLSAPYAPDHQDGLRWDDTSLSITWPLKGTPLLSPRDASYDDFSVFETPFP